MTIIANQANYSVSDNPSDLAPLEMQVRAEGESGGALGGRGVGQRIQEETGLVMDDLRTMDNTSLARRSSSPPNVDDSRPSIESQQPTTRVVSRGDKDVTHGDASGTAPMTIDERPYSVFSTGMKWAISALVGIAAIFSPLSSNVFVPAIPAMSTAFNRSEQDITLSLTSYLVFQAITPSFLGSLSDSYGRRPIIIAALIVYVGANVGLALLPTHEGGYAGLLVLRAVQATGGSCLVAIGAGCVSDVAEPREKGLFMSIFQFGIIVGPAFGPLLGGVLAQTLGWRSIFWFLTIAAGVVLVPLIFLLPETLRSLVGDGSIPPPPLNSSPQQLWQRHKAAKERSRKGGSEHKVERPERQKYRPFSSFLILLTPEITLVFIFTSMVYLEFYCVLAVYSTALKNAYGLTELQIGLCYLPCGAGAIISTLLNGRLIDLFYRKEEQRAGGDFRKCRDNFNLERARFVIAIPFLIVFAVGCLALGWTLQYRTHLAAVLVSNFLIGIGSGFINLATVYGQDIVPKQGGAVSASLNLIRCIFAALGTAVIQLLYDRMGAGWTFTFFTVLCVISAPVVVWFRGAKWRRQRDDKERAIEEERQRQARLGVGEGSRPA